MTKDITSPQKIGLIGYGHWGKKIYNTVQNRFPHISIVVADTKIANNNMPFSTLDQILSDIDVSHVCIATPEETHYDIAKKSLEYNKHVFVEKPTALYSVEAKNLEKLAKKANKTLYTDYIFLHDETTRQLKNWISANLIGEIKHIESIRHSIEINKPDITVFDDLAIHDIYLGRYIYNAKKIKIKSVISQQILNKQTDQASVVLNFDEKTYSAQYSWAQPTAKRTLTIIGEKGTLVWDRNSTQVDHYKKYNLVKKIKVEYAESSLERSLKEFFSLKSIVYEYSEDIKILEKLRNFS